MEWYNLLGFSVGVIISILITLYITLASGDKRWPFREKKDKTNSGAKFG